MTRAVRILAVIATLCAAASARAQMSVSAQSTSGAYNQTVNVDIVLSNPGAAPIDAFGFRLTYPSTILSFQGVSAPGTLTQSWIAVDGDETSPGVVQVGGFNFTPITGGGVLVRVAFHVDTNLITSGSIALSNLVDDIASASTTTATFQAAVAAGTAGLLGEYFSNMNLTGLVFQRIDTTVNFDWGNSAPDPSMATNYFSIRWTGFVQPQYTQTYTFYTVTDDGCRLYVNNQLVVDSWIDQAAIERSGTIALTAGTTVSIRMEMYENAGEAVAQLSWSSASQPKQIIPSTRLVAAVCTQGTGDVDGSGLLAQQDVDCAFDIFLADQSALGTCDYTNTSCEVTSADVNCSGSVTPADARALDLRVAASLGPAACFATVPAPPAPPYTLGLIQQVVNDGGTQRLQVLVVVDDPVGLDAFGARLTFPSAQLQLNRVEPGFLTAGFAAIGGRTTAPGQMNFGGFDPALTAPLATADVCRIYFDFLGAPGTVGGLVLSNLVDDFTGATVGTVTGVDAPSAPTHQLHQNVPNPFNPTTQVRYDVGGVSGARVHVRIAIYDVRGAHVRTLFDGERTPGSYVATWDGRGDDGRQAASGVYFYSMRAGDYAASRRMVLLK